MNNNHTPNYPDVPEDVPKWQVFTTLFKCRQDWGANENEQRIHRLGRRTLLVQLKLMSNTQCIACSGFGHRARDCATNDRLSMLGNAS